LHDTTASNISLSAGIERCGHQSCGRCSSMSF